MVSRKLTEEVPGAFQFYIDSCVSTLNDGQNMKHCWKNRLYWSTWSQELLLYPGRIFHTFLLLTDDLWKEPSVNCIICHHRVIHHPMHSPCTTESPSAKIVGLSVRIFSPTFIQGATFARIDFFRGICNLDCSLWQRRLLLSMENLTTICRRRVVLWASGAYLKILQVLWFSPLPKSFGREAEFSKI